MISSSSDDDRKEESSVFAIISFNLCDDIFFICYRNTKKQNKTTAVILAILFGFLDDCSLFFGSHGLCANYDHSQLNHQVDFQDFKIEQHGLDMSRLKNQNVQASISSSSPSSSSSSSTLSSATVAESPSTNEKTKLTDLFDDRNINIRWNSINLSDNHHNQFSDKNSNTADWGESSSTAAAALSENSKGINEETPPSSSPSSALYMNPAQTDLLLNERTVSQVDIVAKNNNKDQVALDDEIIAVQNNNVNLIRLNQNEVEPNNNNNNNNNDYDDEEEYDDDGNKHVLNQATTFGTIPFINDTDSDEAQSSCLEVSIITEPNPQQSSNLKPILKRKDSIDLKNQSNAQSFTVLPPPILKKRDSIVDNCPIQCSNFTTNPVVGNASTLNQQKPLSILKNRQTKLSYSFDDNIGPIISTAESSIDDQCSAAHQLKPILKKKSWSIEEKATIVGGANGGSSGGGGGGIPSLCDGVKGILKSSDKSTSTTSSSSSRNSILDEATSVSYSATTSTTNQPSATTIQAALSHRTVLKGILKSSYKNRSTSLSPCNSTDSLVDDLETYRVSLPHNLKSASFRKRTSLDSTTTVNLFDFELFKQQQQQQQQQQARTTEDNSQISVINFNLKPILKRNSFDSQIGGGEDQSTEEDHLVTTKSTTDPTTFDHSIMSSSAVEAEDCQNGDSDGSRMPTSSSSSNVTLRAAANGNNETTSKARPKSCFVSSTEINNTISQRLALLKRNGEHAWKTRIQKKEDYLKDDLNNNSYPINSNDDDDKNNNNNSNNNDDSCCISQNTARNNAIVANRVSLLLESQTKWKNRVPEKDAKQFTVTSKLNQTTTTTTTKKNVDQQDRGVVLRETSKRSGLRGSSLSEKKLGAISSKLNSVFGAKSPFGLPASVNKTATITSSDKKDSGPPRSPEEAPAKEFRLTFKTNEPKRSDQPIVVLKPDDEESFGSFFDLDRTKVEQILNQNPGPEHSVPLFDSLEDASSSIKLLSANKRCRILAPKRRAASEKNPAKLLAKTAIAIDTYQPPPPPLLADGNVVAPKEPSPPASPSSISSNAKDFDSKYAISALAGLASVEDFKSVASNLRRSSSGNNSSIGNDCWRTLDLKNSIQSKMLIMVKGRRKAHIRLVEPGWRSLNQMDSFILVTKTSVLAYIGRYSNIIERTKCVEIAELIRKRKDLCLRSSNCELKLIDCQDGHHDGSSLFDSLLPLLKELDDFSEESDREEFSTRFEQTTTDIDLDEDDEFYEEFINHSNMVYVVNYDDRSDAEKATLKLAESYSGRSPRHQILQPDSALIFDFGSEMYVWLGKGVSNIVRKKAVEAAKDLWLAGYDFADFEYNPLGRKYPAKSEKRPDWSWFIRVNQNMEPILFKDKFFNWPAFTLTRPDKKKKKQQQQVGRRSSFTDQPVVCEQKKEHRCVKKDLSAELNLFPVDVLTDMINKQPKIPELVLEFVPLGRGAGDVIQDEDGLPVKVISLDMQSFYIDHSGDRVELNEKDRTFLCSGESYYIRWKYRLTRISRNLKTGGESRFSEQHGGRDRVCYFVWQGKHAKNTKRGLTALNAIEKLRVEGASQTYVEHGSEDPVFLRIFQASLVIQNGKRNQIHRGDIGYRMFMLMDTDPKEEFMVELECSFKNLRSRMSYMFAAPGHSRKIYLWHGCKSQDGKRKSIRNFVETKLLRNKSPEFGFVPTFDHEISELDEGQESKDFMEIFHNASSAQSPDSTLKRASKSNLHRDIYFSLLDDPRPYDFTPRLFHFVTMDNIFRAIEIVPSYLPPKNIVVNYPFVQDDLYERAKCRPTFFLFDAEYEVYLWESKHPFFIYNQTKTEKRNAAEDADDDDPPQMIDIENEIQSESNKSTGFMSQLWLAERKCALETTLAYCHAKNASEPPKSYVICAGLEPDAFCGLFPTWTYHDNVAKSHIEDGRKPGEQILVQEMLSQIEDINQSMYSYEELKRRPLPEGINILCLESYLDDEEFKKVFSMNREEFCSLPTWKQKIMKQEKELF